MTKSSRLATFMLLMAASNLFAGVDTITPWNGTSFISSFGVTNTATYGQTITMPNGVGPLTSFAFEIGNCTAAVIARAEVYAWDGTKATGPSLYESPTITIATGAAFTLYTFNTGGLVLTPGTYVIFASTSKDQTGQPGSSCRWGSTPNTTYAGGTFVFLNNGPTPASWTTSNWSTIASNLAFTASFSNLPSTPAPNTLVLLVVGMIGLAAFAGRAFKFKDRT